jgi:uncharacterized protein (UPF0335 family)
MSTPNPQVAEELRQAQEELARLKAEKLQLYPPNPHPLVDPNYFAREFSASQVEARNKLIERIEQLEQRVQNLQDRLYQK